MTPEQAATLRAPFPDSAIGYLPKAGIKLAYVGHAAVCARLLEVDPAWTWEPMALAMDGTPYWSAQGNDAVMWIRLTIAGVTRLGVGIVAASAFELEKQLISDALRNAAMRFGVALDLWSKEDLQAVSGVSTPEEGAPSPVSRKANGDGKPEPEGAVSANQLQQARERAAALQAEHISVASERKAAGLPTLSPGIAPGTFSRWLELLDRLDQQLEDSRAPFEPETL